MSTPAPLTLEEWSCTTSDVASLGAGGYFTKLLPPGYAFKILRVTKALVTGGTSTVHGVAITDSRVEATGPFDDPDQAGIIYLSSDPSTTPPTADTVAAVTLVIDEVPSQPVCGSALSASDREIRIWTAHDNNDGDCEITVYVELWPSRKWTITS